MLTCKPFQKSEGVCGYLAEDGERGEQAELLFRQDGMYLTLLSARGDVQNAELCEMLLRGALSYGANRNAFVARARTGDTQLAALSSQLSAMGFSEKDGMLEAEIPDVLLGDCKI